jgi:hypothetical protein
MPIYPNDDRNEKVEYFLDACETEARNLSKWESDFLLSLRDQFDRSGALSDKQYEILERIYVEKV